MISCDRSPLEIAGYCIASVDGTMTVLVNKSKQTTSKTTNLPPTGQILTPNESKMRPVGGRLVLASLLDLYLEDSILPRQLDSPVAYQPISHGMAVWGAMKILRDSWDSIQWLRYARSARASARACCATCGVPRPCPWRMAGLGREMSFSAVLAWDVERGTELLEHPRSNI